MAGPVHVGDVVFRRTNDQADDAQDLWDDSALIIAYDNAVNSLKSKLDSAVPPVNGLKDDHCTRTSNKKQKNKKKKKRKQKTESALWQVGDRCRALYSEDGLAYDAVIKSLDPPHNSCVVRYCGYGNEEQQQLDDLLPRTGASAQRGRAPDALSDVTSEADSAVCGAVSGRSSQTDTRSPPRNKQSRDTPGSAARGRPASSARERTRTNDHSARLKSQRPGGEYFFSPSMGFPSFPFSAPDMFAPPCGAPGWGRMPGSMPPPPSFPPMGAMPGLPTVPPPPMPDEDCPLDDKEALYSMLISWYMSGYHTGYYQGLKQRGSKSDVVDMSTDGSSTTSSVRQREDSTSKL